MTVSSSDRPLSPHLSIYRPQITSMLSITHRATGVALSAGALLLVIWLWAAAYDASLFALLHDLMKSLLGKLMMVGWTLSFYYHLANGLRHLGWDMGKGLELREATRSGWLVVLFTLAMTALTWAFVYRIF